LRTRESDPLTAIAAQPIQILPALLFVPPATARNGAALPRVRARRGDGVAAIAFAKPCRPASAALLSRAVLIKKIKRRRSENTLVFVYKRAQR
jgi:hypothetical protein